VREFTLGTVRTDIEESFENWVEDEIDSKR
jgi:hypothetical protein